jgi:hypothetical protein
MCINLHVFLLVYKRLNASNFAIYRFIVHYVFTCVFSCMLYQVSDICFSV